MNLKKAIFLFLALLFPTGVFVFLKFFGKNEFRVPYLFSEGIEKPLGCESFTYAYPYTIHDSVFRKLSWRETDSISLVIFNSSGLNKGESLVQIKRIFAEFPADKFQVINSEFAEGFTDLDNRLVGSGPMDATTRDCVFLLKPSDNTAVVDFKRRIRGQYDISNREDVDRLILEMKVMLKKY